MLKLPARLFLTLIISLCWALPAFAVTGLPDEIPEELLEQASNSYIFVFDDRVEAGQIRKLVHQLAQQSGAQVRHTFSTALKGFSATVSAAAAARIAATPHVCGILLFQDIPAEDGYAINDPDGEPDPIAHR